MTNNKQQTAVEWLFNQMFDPTYPTGEQKDWLEQALQMEKEQIEDAYINSETGYHSNDDAKAMAKHYYEQNYGKEASHE